MLDTFANAEIVLNYGLTETYRTSFLDPKLVRQRPSSIGKAIPGVDVVIVRDDGTIADADEEGHIVHRGDYICLGYWGDPESTAQTLRPDPLVPGERAIPGHALFTGDYGRIDKEGFLYFHGRRDHQLKSMGVRVSPTEVEQLLNNSGLVNEVAIFGMPQDLIGDEIWAALTSGETLRSTSA